METTKPKQVDVASDAVTVEVSRPTSQDTRPASSALKPELRRALEASWERNEEAYRYLGR
jgi:hypothetical protein